MIIQLQAIDVVAGHNFLNQRQDKVLYLWVGGVEPDAGEAAFHHNFGTVAPPGNPIGVTLHQLRVGGSHQPKLEPGNDGHA